MTKLKEVVSKFKEDLAKGDMWVLFWRKEKEWEGFSFYVIEGEQISPFIKPSLENISRIDPKAVVVNGNQLNCAGKEIDIFTITTMINRYHDTCTYTLVSFLEYYKKKESKRMSKDRVIEMMENELEFLFRLNDGEFMETEKILMVSEQMLEIAKFLVEQKENTWE